MDYQLDILTFYYSSVDYLTLEAHSTYNIFEELNFYAIPVGQDLFPAKYNLALFARF